MILWLNGAFGAGKTTAAWELRRRLAGSFVYDPENVGYFLRKNAPEVCRTEDFQDMPLWRTFNVEMLRELHGTCRGPVIVPMTLVNPAYYEEIIQRLRGEGIPVEHVILYASRETVLGRLKKRSLGFMNREAFAVEALDRCLEFFDRRPEGVRIETDGMTVERTVERIGEACGLALLPDERGRIARAVGRLETTLRHIRS